MHFEFLIEDQSGAKAMEILLPKLLGNKASYRIAVRKAYPKAKDAVLNGYKNDEICGTWELLADAVCKGGNKALKKEGWQAIGKQKSVWAKEITPNMNVDCNLSPSFNNMRLQLQSVTGKAG